MLILTRKINERITIGSDIVIVVTRIHGNTVSIGIEAPAETTVRRDELPTIKKPAVKKEPPRD